MIAGRPPEVLPGRPSSSTLTLLGSPRPLAGPGRRNRHSSRRSNAPCRVVAAETSTFWPWGRSKTHKPASVSTNLPVSPPRRRASIQGSHPLMPRRAWLQVGHPPPAGAGSRADRHRIHPRQAVRACCLSGAGLWVGDCSAVQRGELLHGGGQPHLDRLEVQV
jgi:hypothetical protein